MIRLSGPLATISCLLLAATARTEDVPPASFPAIPGARAPRAGEWIEYVVSFPLDPLEHSIRSGFAPNGGDQNPSFDPPQAWSSVPLRLEILKADGQGYQAAMTYGGFRQEVILPLFPAPDAAAGRTAPSDSGMEVRGDIPGERARLDDVFAPPSQPADQTAFRKPEDDRERHWLGDTAIEVDVARNSEPYVGYTRLTSPEAPFGLARFANSRLDMILVGVGAGIPPEFPLADIHIDPPPGELHR